MTRKETKIVEITCDGCGAEVSFRHAPIRLPKHTESQHYCEKCCKGLEAYSRRILYNEVRSRRGGWRTLGEYDS